MLFPISLLMVWASSSLRVSAMRAASNKMALRWWAGVRRHTWAPFTAEVSAESTSASSLITTSPSVSPEKGERTAWRMAPTGWVQVPSRSRPGVTIVFSSAITQRLCYDKPYAQYSRIQSPNADNLCTLETYCSLSTSLYLLAVPGFSRCRDENPDLSLLCNNCDDVGVHVLTKSVASGVYRTSV